MKITVLVPELGLPSTRIRWEQMFPHLSGCEGRVCPFPRTAADRSRLAAELEAGDLVVVHRALPSVGDRDFLARLAVPRLFDFDDAIMFRKRPRWWRHRSPKASAAFERALSVCAAATPGNRFLAEQCADRVASLQITPSAVPIDVPQVDHGSDRGVLRIGWVGLSDNFRYLRPMRPILRQLARTHEFVFTVLSDRDLEWDACAIENWRWSLDEQEQRVAELDIGIMPLTANSPWARGKCAYKLLQSMAAGAAVVGARVGTNCDVIDDGRNGFLCSGRSEWIAKLGRLLADPDLRGGLGKRARRTAEGYGYPAIAAELGLFLRRIASSA